MCGTDKTRELNRRRNYILDNYK